MYREPEAWHALMQKLATLVGDALARQGLLVPVLAEYVDPLPVPVYAVTASHRHRLPKIQACIDYWAGWFGAATPVKRTRRA